MLYSMSRRNSEKEPETWRDRERKKNEEIAKAEIREKEHDDLFFPKPPKNAGCKTLAAMSIQKKKERFLQSYNARGGNETFAMMESGLSRAQVKVLLTEDEDMMAAVAEIKIQIKDRAKYLLMQRIGLVKVPNIFAMAKVADNLLLQSAKALDKDLFGDEGGGTIKLILNIPRPERGTGDNGQLRADGKADAGASLPS